MARQPAQSPSYDSLPSSSPSSVNHFQFTFNCSASNSGGNSFIEPDNSSWVFATSGSADRKNQRLRIFDG
ncbi:hypothetical protein ACHAP5_000015 [Fusarium lateritium]